MSAFNIKRVLQTTEVTMGAFICGDRFFAVTVEPPTPIPAGTYTLKLTQLWPQSHLWWMKEKFGYEALYYYQDVPGHQGVAVHIGNFAQNTLDCTLPNKIPAGNRGIDSEGAYKEFIDLCQGADTIQIKIEDHFNEA